jgi:hypothetical protein
MHNAPPQVTSVVIKRKPDRLEDPANFLADDFEDEDIQLAVDKLAPLCDEHRRRSFQWYYETGKIVRQHYEALAERRDNMYGERFFLRLAQDLNRPGVSGPLLSNCYRLVKNYTEEDYLKVSRNPAISPTHLLMLAGIADRKQRNKFIQKVASDKLTTKQLDSHLKKEFGFQRASGAGRPVKLPKDPKAGLVHFNAQADKFAELNSSAWFGDRYDIINVIKDLPATLLTDDLRGQLADAAGKSEILASTAANDAKRLRAALAEVDCRREAQARVNEKVQEEEKQHEEEQAA